MDEEEAIIKLSHAEDGQRVRAACASCDNLTWHLVHAALCYQCIFNPVGVSVELVYQIVVCQGCNDVSFRRVSTDSETRDEGERIDLFPGRLRGRKPLVASYFFPERVRKIYDEAHAALASGLKILAAVGIRALVEAICREENATGNNLEKRIDALRDQGKLTPDGARILHKTRFLGNRAAHEIDSPSDESLNTAMEVVEHTLKSVYILPKISKKLPLK